MVSRNGDLLPLRMNDILYMLSHLKSQSDFAYGFRQFQFTKNLHSQTAFVQLNFQSLLQGAPDHRIWLNRSLANSKVFLQANNELYYQSTIDLYN